MACVVLAACASFAATAVTRGPLRVTGVEVAGMAAAAAIGALGGTVEEQGLAAEEACGAVPVEDSFGIVLDCMLEAPPSCTAACQAIIPCVPEQDLTQASCETYCAMGGLGDPDTVGACIEAGSDTNCNSVFACLEEESSPVPPLCAAMCGKLTTTCQLPGFACEQGCAAEMEEGSGVSAAGKICVLMAECSEIDACQQLDDKAVPAGCQSACAATPEACGDLPGGCEAACQGVMAAQPGFEGAADCIMATAGAQCQVCTCGHGRRGVGRGWMRMQAVQRACLRVRQQCKPVCANAFMLSGVVCLQARERTAHYT